MVFSETLYEEEHIFEDYYLSDNVYFRLKQAYLAYVTREYIVYGRSLEKCVFEIIANECDQKEDLPDVVLVEASQFQMSAAAGATQWGAVMISTLGIAGIIIYCIIVRKKDTKQKVRKEAA